MSLRQWNTSFECKQLTKIATSLALYQANLGVSQPEEEIMLESLLSSSAVSSSSSSSSSSSAMASGMDLDNAMDVDPVLLKLIVTTTTLDKINSTILDDGISWGHTPTMIDLSESNALENCRLHKVDLQTLTDKLWPLILVHLCGDRSRITCVNQYTIKYENGILILLYRLSRP